MLLASFFASGLILTSPLGAAVLTGVNPTIFTVGTGSDVSYLVIDESSLYATPLEFIYHYTYDSNNLITGKQMMQSIANDTSLGFTIGSTYGELASISIGCWKRSNGHESMELCKFWNQ